MPRVTLTRVLTPTQTETKPTTPPTPLKTQKVRTLRPDTFFSSYRLQGHAFGSGYRTNASSSSSLGPPRYGLNSDGMYQSSFGDASYPSNPNPYGDIGSYNSGGKVSPLTPTDPVSGIHHPSPFSNKDYPPNYSDLGPDSRRMPTGNYPSEFGNEDYAFASGNALPHFQERLPPRFSPDTRFNNHGGHPPPPTNHLNHGGPDMLRSVAPNATHSPYRHESYEEPMPHYGDLRSGLADVDNTLREMNLQPPRPMGSSTDLHTYIRHVKSFLAAA